MDKTVLLETFEQLGETTEYEMEDIRSFLQVKQYQEHPENWENFLDEIDEILASRDRWVIMAYDQIDRISPEHDVMYSYIRTLIMYWERINMPEIYLHGFGLRRRDALRRPK